MRSIFVLLILVMIGLNGKGQSVTALPDSVLSQCCLEVTLLNGNVTTVDWVFVQYITRDGTGTKLFVEYAPNFGGIQWETQIRIQDDFDDVLERSKFIVIPFTVGSTDYGINRNWIANIEENTTTGGTWIYGRFGTPTKRKFSAVEDYETMKNLLLACRPRAIVVAENGLYTEGDTVRMGGFLIENTSITTEGYNWQMKDTLSSAEFGLDYDSPINGDTAAYFARRWGLWRQIMEMGQKRWMSEVRDTTGGDWSQVSHGFTNGSPIPYFIVESSNNAGTQYSQLILQKNFASWTMIDPFNSNYTMGFQMNSSAISIGANDANGPGNGPSMGAYAFGSAHYLYLKTDDVDNGTASVGQFLQLKNLGTGEVDFATIDLSAYLPIADTAAMLDPYIQGAGTINRVPIFTGSRVIGNSNIQDNNTAVSILSSKPFQLGQWTTAGRPSGTTGYEGYNTTGNGKEWYQGSRWAYALESTFARGTATRVPFFDANGQVTDNSLLTYTSGTGVLKTTNYTFNEAPNITLDPFGTSELALIMPTGGVFTIFSSAGAINPFYTNQTLGTISKQWEKVFVQRVVTSTAGTASAPILTYRAAGSDVPSGMYWVGNFANHDLAFSTNALARLYITYAGLIGVNTTSPTQDIDINGDLYARDSSRLATTPSHSSITGLLTRDANGWVGRARLGTDFTYAGDSIKLTSSPTWLKPQLESIGNVKITSTNSLTFKTGITRWTGSSEQTGTYISPGFIGLYKTSAGNIGGAVGFTDTIARDNAFYFQQDDRGIIQNTGTGRQLNLLVDNTSLPGQYRWAFGARVDTSSSPLATLRVMLGDRYASTTAPVMVSVNAGIQPSESIANAGVNIVVAGDNGKKAFSVNNLINARVGGKVYFAEDSTFSFDPSTDILQLSQYGAGNKEASDLSKTQSKYIAGFATDGTVLDLEIKRDTTIYIDDADYDFSAAITTAQIASRFNRVIFWMTTTAAAGTDSELTLHTPDVNLMQVEYLIHSVDEAGGFDNRILFGTNNAVSSTNTLASSYYPAAGQGVGIRTGLRSGVYKYRYY
jgi:hypothetical protein